MTYRERRLRKAERLREWADKRETKSDAASETATRIASAIPFGQPILVGHHSERRDRNYRDRIGRNMDRAVEHGRKADDFRSRAGGIEAAADRSIYSDDPDAVDKLRERIAELEAQRERYKAENAAYRKAHKAELAGMTAYERSQAVPHPGYELTNLGGNITRNRKRLEQLGREAAGPVVTGRPNKYPGPCRECDHEVAARAGVLVKNNGGWEIAHAPECPTERTAP